MSTAAEAGQDVARGGDYERSDVINSLPATLLLTTLSSITAISFCRVFAGWHFLGPMLFVVIGTHLFCLLMRAVNAPGYVAIPASLVMIFVLIAWKYYPATLSGPLPTMRTWDQLVSELRLAREQFPSAVAPVAVLGGFAVVATAATALAAMLSDAFAFRAYGRAEAVVPSAVLFLFASALGADRNRVVVTAAWLGCALGVVALLRVTHAQTEHSWIGSTKRVLISVVPIAALLAGCAAAGGAWLGPRLPGAGAKALVDTSQHNDVTQVLSPLVDIRSRLVNLSNTELFTVAADEPSYWRATGLSLFDGTTWKLPDGDLAAVYGTIAGMPVGAREIVQQIHIAGLGGNLLPAAYSPIRIEDGSVYWVRDTGTLVVPNAGLQRASNYTIVSAVVDPTPEELNAATSLDAPGSPPTELPGNFPRSVAQTAADVTAGASTTYGKAMALQTWFRTEFTYDLTVLRGHSNDALENFLRTRRGYCEQFAGAFAAMARSLGIPARVAVGFTPGDLQADGRYHVFGRNAHAWPEVWFDGIGWVAFEPTPGRGEPGAQQHTGVEPQQASPPLGSQVTPTTIPTATTAVGNSPSTTVPDDAAPAQSTPVAPNASGGSGGESGGTSPWLVALGLVVIAALVWALALPRVLAHLRQRRRGPTPADEIRISWQRATQALGLLSLAPHPNETPLEHASRAGRAAGIDARTLHELALHVTAAVYGGIGTDETAHHCSELAGDIVRSVKELIDTRDRVMALFDPRRAGLLLS